MSGGRSGRAAEERDVDFLFTVRPDSVAGREKKSASHSDNVTIGTHTYIERRDPPRARRRNAPHYVEVDRAGCGDTADRLDSDTTFEYQISRVLSSGDSGNRQS